MTNCTPLKNNALKRRELQFTVAIFILYILYALVLVPLNTYIGSDIAFAGTMLLELTELLYELIELLAYALAFAALINCRFCFGLSSAFRVFWIYVGAASFRYIAIFLVSWKMNGLNLSNLGLELVFLLAYILLDVTQMIVAFVAAHLFCSSFERVFSVRSRALLVKGAAEEDKLSYVVPYRGVISRSNPLQCSAIACGVIILIARVVGRIIYDVSYGAPTDAADLAWMIFYYLGDVTISVLVCALIMLLVRKMDCKTESERLPKKKVGTEASK